MVYRLGEGRLGWVNVAERGGIKGEWVGGRVAGLYQTMISGI